MFADVVKDAVAQTLHGNIVQLKPVILSEAKNLCNSAATPQMQYQSAKHDARANLFALLHLLQESANADHCAAHGSTANLLNIVPSSHSHYIELAVERFQHCV